MGEKVKKYGNRKRKGGMGSKRDKQNGRYGEWREDTEITLTLLEKGHREKVGGGKKKQMLTFFCSSNKTTADIY